MLPKTMSKKRIKMKMLDPLIVSKFDGKRPQPRDGIEIPFCFEAGPSGIIRLIGDCPGTPPTIIIEAPRSVEVEIVSSADEEK